VLTEEASFTASFGRSKFPPWGLNGGNEGTCNRFWIMRQGAAPEEHGKIAAIKLRKGDMVRMATGGGGGYGRAIEREPEAVQADVIDELLTVDQAQELYSVVLNPQTLEIEAEGTRALRERRTIDQQA
jgi:N-methylhydantoinase B